MAELLDLVITLEKVGEGAPQGSLAKFKVSCPKLGLEMKEGVWLEELLTAPERAQLRWYLEEYWKWPYEEFAERGKKVEGLLPQIGERLYNRVLKHPEAVLIVMYWESATGENGKREDYQRQISLVGEVPEALSLPWELLRDGLGYLALRARGPISIVRRLPVSQMAQVSFEPPLRVLLVTARPEKAGFVDPRSVARELLDEVQGQIEQGALMVEFLRPPTLKALQGRLSDENLPPVQVVHFDGHGTFDAPVDREGKIKGTGKVGQLAFEDEKGELDLVIAERLGQILSSSGVKLVVLTACQSAMGSGQDAFSSVAGQLIKSGVDGVVAMSTVVLVASATKYAEAFYRELAKGLAVGVAQEKTRLALYTEPKRHIERRKLEEEGQPVELQDWWLPHFYQQRALTLLRKGTKKPRKAKGQAQSQPKGERLNAEMPGEPRYKFGGRALELLRMERWLLGQKLVVVHGFGGVGKTALAREAADWLTRTGMFEGACLVRFEEGGNAATLLAELGRFLGIYDASFDPAKTGEALGKVKQALGKRPTLVVADNVESILPGGEAVISGEERAGLWEVLRGIAGAKGGGALVTSRSAAFGDGQMAPGQGVAHLALGGLWAEDAYSLAVRVLEGRGIDRKRAPYEEMKELLKELDHHPLAIQLVVPQVGEVSIRQIRAEFGKLLPKFKDDTETGRNWSLLASLEYSLRRLGEGERQWLERLAVFEGGANEDDLLAVTEIPEAEWGRLRPALEQAALLSAEKVANWTAPFLHFHPVLGPYLRGQREIEGELARRYAERYARLARYLYNEDNRNALAVRALVRRELPNLRRGLGWWIEQGEGERAAEMADQLAKFLNNFGLRRELEEWRRRVDKLVKGKAGAGLSRAEYLREAGLGQDEYNRGQVGEAYARFEPLLGRIEAGAEGTARGRGSYEHSLILMWLGSCLQMGGQSGRAERRLREALAVIVGLLRKEPENKGNIRQRGALLVKLGDTLRDQGRYGEARQAYEESLKVMEQLADLRSQGALLAQLGSVALLERKYGEAHARYAAALTFFQGLAEPNTEGVVWHQLGIVAQEQKEWEEAERCYRESLAIEERLGDRMGAAQTCNQLAMVAQGSGSPEEAERWYRRALDSASLPAANEALVSNNLAKLIMDEVRAGRAGKERLAEARGYAEKALAFRETLDASSEMWRTLNILAEMAEMEGKTEEAREYQQRERETFAVFEGNRWQIRQQHGDLIRAVAAVAKGDEDVKAVIEDVFPKMEAGAWGKVPPVIRRIWAGERVWEALVEELGGSPALFVKLVLEEIEGKDEGGRIKDEEVEKTEGGEWRMEEGTEEKQSGQKVTMEELLRRLPRELVEAIRQGDQEGFARVMQALPEEEQRVSAILQYLQAQAEEDE